jgi:hypothetical protein
MKGIWKRLDMGRNTMIQDTAVHSVGNRKSASLPPSHVVAVYATIWTVGSAAALLGKLLYPLQHNAENHKRCWILNIFCHLKLN